MAQIIGTGRLAATQYDELVKGLQNELSYLELDLSDEAIAQLGPKKQETATKAIELRASVNLLTNKIEGHIAALQ